MERGVYQVQKKSIKILSFILSFIMVFGISTAVTHIVLSTDALTVTYEPSSAYKNSKFYTNLKNVKLTGNKRTDLVNVALSQVGYHEGNSISDLDGMNQSGRNNYTEYGYWYGKNVLMINYGHYYAWCAFSAGAHVRQDCRKRN